MVINFQPLSYLLQIILFILIYYLYNKNKSQIYIKEVRAMTQQDIKNINYTTNDESHIITSDTNNELKKRIKDISQQVLKSNYKLYKALENK